MMQGKFSLQVSSVVLIICLQLFSLVSQAKEEVWLYTSIYKEFASMLKQEFEKKNPEIDLQIYQAGSEKIQTKIEAEVMAKKIQADIITISDIFWPLELKKRNLILTESTGSQTENYYSTMVLVAHRSVKNPPQSFFDLTKPEWKNQIQMGSPLESGSTYTAVAYLQKKYGWKYFEDLKKNQLASQGGNSTVIQKIESGEKKVGIVLLENILAAKKKGSPLEIIYPQDGAILIPSVQVILKNSPHIASAKKIAQFILSPEGQKILLKGFMYSVDAKLPPPEGAKPLKEISKKSLVWSVVLREEIASQAKEIKRKFSSLILE